MQVIRNAAGEVIHRSRNLQGIRRYVGHHAIKVMSVDPLGVSTLASLKDVGGGKLCILFDDGSSFETNFASYAVLKDFVRRWRNAYGATLWVNGEDAGKLCGSTPQLS